MVRLKHLFENKENKLQENKINTNVIAKLKTLLKSVS